MTRGVPPQITAAPLEATVFPYGDAVTAGETQRKTQLRAPSQTTALDVHLFCWHLLFQCFPCRIFS